MIQIDAIGYSIEGRPLFESASAVIPTGHKVGLVGRNGTGKTTLFRLLRGELNLDYGQITIPTRARIGGVAQEAPASSTSLLETVLEADQERASLLKQADTETDPERIAEIQTRLVDIDAWSAPARASTILKGLGFDEAAQHRPCADFSGGWRMRVALAAVLFSAPDILLLDEPTNYLDLEGALWLESYLQKYPHTVIIVSHDRGLLNRAVGGILHLENQKLTYWTGSYDQFAAARAMQNKIQAEAARKQSQRKAHLQSFVDRFRYKASKAKQAQSRLKMIEKMDLITPPEEAANHVFSFPQPDQLPPPIINIESGSVGYGDKTILRNLNLRIDQDDRIALLGRNGMGKSTLSKLLAAGLPLQDGKITRSSKLRIGYFAQHQLDVLRADETPLQHLQRLRPDSAPAKLRAQLAGFGLHAAQVETEVKRLSGGQKARLTLLLATLDAPHLLILDEPTNHLDMESREALAEALAAFEGAVVLVSHDMHLLNLVADRLWLVSDGRVRPYDDDLEAYRRYLLQSDSSKPAQKAKEKPIAEKKPKPSRDQILALRSDLRKAEARIEKLEEMHEKLSAILADPALYEDHRIADLEGWNRKFTELQQAMVKAETLWVAAQEALDRAENT